MKNHRLTFFCITAVFTILAVLMPENQAYSSIKQMPLNDKPIRLISKFHEKDNSFPQRLTSSSEVYVVIYATSTTSDVYVLADPLVDPQQLAHKLESAVSGTILATEPVMYMHKKGYTWADAYVIQPRMWANRAEMRHQVSLILSRLNADGLKTNTILSILQTAKPSRKLHLKGFESIKWNYFKINPDRKDLDFTLSIKLSKYDIFLGWIMQAMTLIICIAGIPVFIYLARKKRTTGRGRRSLFSNGYMILIFLLNAVILSISINRIKSPSRYRFADVWFGINNDILWFLIPVLMPLVFIVISKIIALFVFPLDASERSMPKLTYYESRGKWFLPFLIIYSGLGILAHNSIDSSILVKQRFISTLVIWFFFEHIYKRVMGNWIRMPGIGWRDNELTTRYSKMASTFGLTVKEVESVKNKSFFKRHTAVKYQQNGILRIAAELVENLTLEELDFIVASELAFVAKQYRLRSTITLFCGSILLIWPGMLFITQPMDISIFNWQIWLMIAGISLLVYDKNQFGKHIEESDKTALGHILNTKVAVDALIKASDLLIEQSSEKIPDMNTLDRLTPRRLHLLKKTADEMHLDAESVFGKIEQDDQLTSRARFIADKMNIKFNRVEVVDLPSGKRFVNAGVHRGSKIIVGRSIVNEFTEDEIDFILAHELSHIKNKDFFEMTVFMFVGFIIMLTGAMLILAPDYRLNLYPFWLSLIGSGLIIANITLMSRSRELEADRRALRTTRNLPAAVSVIQKLTKSNPIVLPEELEGYRSHPKEIYRIQSLQREAKKLGIPDV